MSNVNKLSLHEKRKATDIQQNESNKILKPMKLTFDFYNESCEILAKKLLGKILVRQLDCGTILRGKIVETESYLGGEDKASHTYNGRRTQANEPMYMNPGTTYVYMTYGMYYCFNISSDGPGAAVLLRAVDPIEGVLQMQNFRKTKRRTKELKIKELCNGPSKLCISININKAGSNKLDLSNNTYLWIEDGENIASNKIVTTSRIGIASAGVEWANKPLRYYILGNESVSKRDRIAEKNISNQVSFSD